MKTSLLNSTVLSGLTACVLLVGLVERASATPTATSFTIAVYENHVTYKTASGTVIQQADDIGFTSLLGPTIAQYMQSGQVTPDFEVSILGPFLDPLPLTAYAQSKIGSVTTISDYDFLNFDSSTATGAFIDRNGTLTTFGSAGILSLSNTAQANVLGLVPHTSIISDTKFFTEGVYLPNGTNSITGAEIDGLIVADYYVDDITETVPDGGATWFMMALGMSAIVIAGNFRGLKRARQPARDVAIY